MTQSSCDIAVVGAGLVGLATAWQLARRQPGLRITVVEAEARSPSIRAAITRESSTPASTTRPAASRQGCAPAARCSSNSSAPIMTFRSSATARWSSRCVTMKLGLLATLYQRAEANGVPQLRRLTPDELREVEPAVEELAAIHRLPLAWWTSGR